jgi:formylglycine-generating enzyme required for sulfatase activity
MVSARSVLDLFDRLNPPDQLERVMILLGMPQRSRPAATLSLDARQNAIIDWAAHPEGPGLDALSEALGKLIEEQQPVRADPTRYLQLLKKETGSIDLRGLHARTGKALPPVPIDELYIPLTAAGGLPETRGHPMADAREQAEPLQLVDVLARQRLVIVGDPGSGKSTFLKRVAFELSKARLQEGPPSSPSAPATAQPEGSLGFRERLGAALRRTLARKEAEAAEAPAEGTPWPFPILIRIADLAEHIRNCQGRVNAPSTAENPDWLLHFLKARSEGWDWQLDAAFFRQQLKRALAILLFDGLDEATAGTEREAIARLFENVMRVYDRCRFVVSTRPLAYAGQATLDGFELAQIAPLDPKAVEQFLFYWCAALYDDPLEREAHHRALANDLHASNPSIRRMATNPVMLTALAVVHWNEGRLPEQRAELYELTLKWLAESRKKKPRRERPERCLALFDQLALAMQDHKDGRQVQVSKAWAADALAPHFVEAAKAQRRAKALAFLDQEEEDSGIIVSRGRDTCFWHLTFQEYLAAETISGFPDLQQYKLLLDGSRIYRTEWREVALLLAGVLAGPRGQGLPKLNALLAGALDCLPRHASLADRAKCVGLLGAMVRELALFHYEPADPRYQETLDSVLGIFDAEKARGIGFQVRLEAAEALGQAADPRLEQDNWVRIEAGSFWMGAQKENPSGRNHDDQAETDESPPHEVYLDAFDIGRYPVTVQEYKKFIDEEGYSDERWWKQGGGLAQTLKPDDSDDQLLHPNRPVVNVTWYEAAAYCAWRAAREPGVRLPTEAEWERATRGLERGQYRKYPWGSQEADPQRANYDAGHVGHPTPVGLYPRGATPEGVQDMAGNVWEWVGDWYGNYPKSATRNPRGPEGGGVRVLRGGGWSLNPRLLRSADRGWGGPVDRNDYIGFRCAREVVP